MRSLADWLGERPFSLALSSGFFGFYAHSGALAALEEAGLHPAGLAGASSGAIVAGMRAAGCEIPHMVEILRSLRREDFWDPAWGFGLLAGDRLRRLFGHLLPVAAIEDCALPLGISVYDLGTRKTVVLRSGGLAAAMYASCAVPVLFQPCEIDGRWFADGGIDDPWAVAGIAPDARILCHSLPSSAIWSQWRRQFLPTPRGPNAAIFSAHGVPSVHPFALDRGMVAFEAAKKALSAALEEPIAQFQNVED